MKVEKSLSLLLISLVFALTLLFLFLTSCEAQTCNKSVDIKWSWKNPKHTSTERVLATTIVTTATALLDVVLYPIAERSKMVDTYRQIQGAEQLAGTLYLAHEYGWSCAVSYNIDMLCGVNDGIYYIFNPQEFKDTHFNHLNYTPFYLLNGGRLSKTDFKVQIVIGFQLSKVILF